MEPIVRRGSFLLGVLFSAWSLVAYQRHFKRRGRVVLFIKRSASRPEVALVSVKAVEPLAQVDIGIASAEPVFLFSPFLFPLESHCHSLAQILSIQIFARSKENQDKADCKYHCLHPESPSPVYILNNDCSHHVAHCHSHWNRYLQ